MTTEEFNALPLEARRFIETNAGCLGCGNSEAKLTRAYALYKSYKMAHVYTLFGGGINYLVGDKKGVLYNVSDNDEPLEIREKLDLAEKIHASSPHVFSSYDQRAIEELRATLPEPAIVDLRTDEEKAEAAKAAEEAAKAWTKRVEVLGIDTKTAEYPDLKAFAKAKGLEVKSEKKASYIEAIDAIEVDLL